MIYNLNDIKWLLKINHDNIEVLIENNGEFEWILLSEGILKTKTLVYDHRYLGCEVGIVNKIESTEKYITNKNGECII